MSAPIRCATCGDICWWSVATECWGHISGTHFHRATVSPSPEADASRAKAEADYAAYSERVRRADEQRERAFESLRRGLEG